MKNVITIFLLTMGLYSCNNNPEIKIQLDNAGGLTSGSSVHVNGLKVGDVKDLSLNQENKVIVKVSLDKGLPIDSKFYLSNTSLLGGTELEVKTGQSKENFKGGELVIGQEGKSTSIIDTLGNKALDILNAVISSPTKQDSILIELRRLNNNLEKLEDKK